MQTFSFYAQIQVYDWSLLEWGEWEIKMGSFWFQQVKFTHHIHRNLT